MCSGPRTNTRTHNDIECFPAAVLEIWFRRILGYVMRYNRKVCSVVRASFKVNKIGEVL